MQVVVVVDVVVPSVRFVDVAAAVVAVVVVSASGRVFLICHKKCSQGLTHHALPHPS